MGLLPRRPLPQVEGIGPKCADNITSAWADQKVIREITVFQHEQYLENGYGKPPE